ncbi:hypothetical protein ACFSTC_12570 [Nonomuraea ferruginea]
MFSAADDGALTALTERLRDHLGTGDGEDLADVAFTLQVSRGGFARRRAVVCRDREDAVAALGDPERWIDGKTQRRNPRVRLVAPDSGVPEEWWAELHAAAGCGAAPGFSPGRAAGAGTRGGAGRAGRRAARDRRERDRRRGRGRDGHRRARRLGGRRSK